MSRPKFWAVLGLTAVAVVALFVTSVFLGPTPVSPALAADSLLRYDPSVDAHLAFRDIRLPRSVLILLVGAALATAGAVMQGVTRNPLAGPSIMGLSGGASLAAVVALIIWPSMGYTGSIAISFVGAAAGYGTVLAVTALSPGGFAPARMALAGSVMSSLFSAITQGLVVTLSLSGSLMYWTVGGVTNVTWEQVLAVLPFLAAGLAAVLWLAPDVTLLSLGQDIATGLGQRTGVVKVATTIAVLVLTGTAVAVAGPVAFVGLVTPHICRLIVGDDYRLLIPLTAVAGAVLTGGSDLIARTILGSKGELPLGVVTAVLGAPVFLWLLRAKRKQSLDGGPTVGSRRPVSRPARHMLALLAVGLVVTSAASLLSGRAEIPWDEVGRALIGQGEPEAELILWSFRIPRLAFALLVGLGVAVSGAVVQAVLRNDLAEPGICGVSSGASFALVLLLAFVGRSALDTVFFMPAASLVGALGVMLAVYFLTPRASSPVRLLLTGVAVTSVVSSFTLFLSLKLGPDTHAFVVAFGAGSLNAAGWNYVGTLAAVLVALVPLAWSMAPTLNILRLGDSAAIGLGVSLPWTSLGLLALGVAICSACMSLAGGVLFIGMIAPHIARRLVGADHKAIIPAAGMIGASLLAVADLLGQSIIPGVEIPAGVMASALGAPYFLYLLTRS